MNWRCHPRILALTCQSGLSGVMRNRLPSMMSLRAFEAAARHLSFTRAAIELNLTQTAISHQIKNLEDLLGVKLFVRNANNISLSEVGEAYLRSIRAAIIEISAATDRASRRTIV